jgi:Arc/MetJ-type ribon-helix-helix transcriptional regulator
MKNKDIKNNNARTAKKQTIDVEKKQKKNPKQKEKKKSEQQKEHKENQKQEDKEGREQEQHTKRQSAFDEFSNHVEKIAVKTAESIRKVIDKALASRNTVLTIRVNDESNRKMNMLVEAGLFKSRSESAAYLIHEGIKTQDALFKKISVKLEKIEKLREELKKAVSEELISEDGPKKP